MKRFLTLAFFLCSATASMAQTTSGTALNTDISGQLQKMLSNPKNSEALGQAMAVGSILGCTQKQVGKEATQKFYQDMQAVGKTVSDYCKQGHATEARALVLSTLETNQTDPVYQAALGCYDGQFANINSLAGPVLAQKITTYAAWARDVPAAKQNVKESDVCRKAAAR